MTRAGLSLRELQMAVVEVAESLPLLAEVEVCERPVDGPFERRAMVAGRVCFRCGGLAGDGPAFMADVSRYGRGVRWVDMCHDCASWVYGRAAEERIS